MPLRTLSRRFLRRPSPPVSKPTATNIYPKVRHQSSSSPPTADKTRTRIDRVLSHLPKFLHPYTNGLRSAPISHITSFLILHELTAIVPLLGLAGLFHYSNWLPLGTNGDGKFSAWVSQGTERFGRYFGRKGWFGFSRADEGSTGAAEEKRTMSEEEMEERIERKWHVGEQGSRILIEIATAYAVTKLLLPVRIVASVWATPWFAMAVLGRAGRLFGRGNSARKIAEAGNKVP